MKRYCLIFFLISLVSQGQTIKGKASDASGSLPFISIMLKKSSSPEIVEQFTQTDKDGLFSLQVNLKEQSLILEAQSINHEPIETLVNFDGKNEVEINFFLHPRTTTLPEVAIEYKKPPIKEVNDTTTFNPNNFKDGTERVVEDLLKKLPGVKVEEDGKISFKGKNISKLLLDGDDLFSSQYAIGSRNINVDLIKDVQAIENFAENPLLKGLLNDYGVAINLRLKKLKNVFSGTANIGLGTQNNHYVNMSGIALTQKHKSFVVASSNSIGLNYSPYHFLSGFSSVEDHKDLEFLAPKIINEGSFYSQLPAKFYNLNRNFYSSLNSVFKLNKNNTTRLNVGVHDDRIKMFHGRESEIFAENENFLINTSEGITKKPRIYDFKINTDQRFGKNASMIYDAKLLFGEVSTENRTNNNGTAQENSITTEHVYFKNNLNFTKRISDNEAFQVNGLFFKNQSPQEFFLLPGNATVEGDSVPIKNLQNSEFDKNTAEKSFYFKKRTRFSWKSSLKYRFQHNRFHSDLVQIYENQSIVADAEFKNNLTYNHQHAKLGNELLLVLKKISIALDLALSYHNLNVTDKVRHNSNNHNVLFLEPTIALMYDTNPNSRFKFTYNYQRFAPNTQFLFEGLVQTNYRGFQRNIFNADFRKNHVFNLNYGFQKLSDFRSFNVGISHNVQENSLFNEVQIRPNFTTSTAFLSNFSNKNFTAFFRGDQYIQPLRAVFEVLTNYTVGENYNMVNSSDVRKVTFNNWQTELTVKPGVAADRFFINNVTTFNRTQFSVDGQKSNSLLSLKNATKVVYKFTPHLNFNSNLDFVTTDLATNNNYWFWDAQLILKAKNKKIDYSITGKNLTGNKTFETVAISDYSRTTSYHSLILRYVMFQVNFQF